MKSRLKTRLLSGIVCFAMLISLMPSTALAYYADGPLNDVANSTNKEYTIPAGETFERYAGSYIAEPDGFGSDYLFVIKKDGKYYTMQDMGAAGGEFETIPAIDITSWVSADGKSLTVPADPGDVAFIRYDSYDPETLEDDYVERINGTTEWDCKQITIEGDSDTSEKVVFLTGEDVSSNLSFFYFNAESGYDYGTYSTRTSTYSNYKNYYIDYIVDLKSDGGTGYEFYIRAINPDNPVISSELATYGRQGDEVEGYMYVLPCRHEYQVNHALYDAPTCMEKGCAEYWYCLGCHRYFKDEAMTQPYKTQLNLDGIVEPILPAVGHDWGTAGCNNCGVETPVYSKITNMEQFLSLGEHTSFILVAEYGGKTYVLDGGDPNDLKEAMDANQDGIADIIDIDDNSNGAPDCLEIDEDSNGVWDYLETNLYDTTNDIIDINDYQCYWENLDLPQLYDDIYTGNAFDGGRMGAIEVTPNTDGTISLTAPEQICFELLCMHTDEEIEENIGWYIDENTSEEEIEALRQELKNNRMMTMPNLWLQPYFCWTDRGYKEDVLNYGDQYIWNIYFYDDIKDKTIEAEVWDDEQASFVMKTMSVVPDNFTPAAGGVYIYGTGDMYGGIDSEWSYSQVENSVRFRDVDGTVDFVAGQYVYDYETGETTYFDNGTQVCIYLYASEPANLHTCTWSDWVADEGKDTHTRTCTDAACGKTETKAHGWDKGVETSAPTCTTAGEMKHTCADCNATKTESIDALNHDWSDWTDDGEDATTDTHSRSCEREGCNQTEQVVHSWSDWTSDNNNNHKKTCSVCSGARIEAHAWDEGVITTQPTEDAEGVKTYTCSVCERTKTEAVPKLEHVHNWSDWGQNDEDTHIRSCRCNETQIAAHNFDDGVVTTEATHINVGIKTFTCADCGYSYTEEIPKTTEHQWTEWYTNGNGTHSRSCRCNEVETRNCTWDDGVITTPPTHVAEGVKTYTCTACDDTKTESIPKTTAHEWGDWHANNDGITHTRECPCDATETNPHVWSDWAVQNDGGYGRECEDCGLIETMTLDEEEPINSTPVDNVANTTLSNTDIELVDKVLTDEEQSQLAAGEKVSIYLVVEDITDSVPTAEVAAATDAAGNSEIGMYLDIDLLKKVGTDETAVTETNGKVTITITIPDNLLSDDDNIIRTYKIVRVHEVEEGVLVTDVIEGVFNPEDNTFTFETDKFSTYALAFADTPFENPFTDLEEGYFYVNPVFWAVQNGITSGTSATTFSPDNPCTRGQVVTFLHRAAGEPEATTDTTEFTDLQAGWFYEDAVLWAVENGITSGTTTTTFSPDAPCTRAQVVTFLWRAMGCPTPTSTENPFTDLQPGYYYNDAVLWAVENGITSGTSATTFSPDEPCTRGQVVTFLCRTYY